MGKEERAVGSLAMSVLGFWEGIRELGFKRFLTWDSKAEIGGWLHLLSRKGRY